MEYACLFLIATSLYQAFVLFLQTIQITLGKRIYINNLTFLGLSNLNTLKIQNTELTSPPPLFSIRQNLRTLEFTNNKLTSIPSNYFSGCENLTVLKLSHNYLTALPDLSAVSNTLRAIELDYNDLIDISSLQDVTFRNLHTIGLGNNKIQNVNFRRLYLPYLWRLHLMHNLIQEIGHPELLVRDSEKANHLGKRPIMLTLSGNPWNCNGKISWMSLAMQRWEPHGSMALYWNGSSVIIVHANAMLCHMPRSMRGKPVLCCR